MPQANPKWSMPSSHARMVKLDLQAVSYAVTVAEHLSFRRAAGALGIRQPALSRRIRRLEDAIGVSIFERHSGGLRLTHSGRAFIRDTRFILIQLEQAVERADRDGIADAGHLTLGFSPSLVSGGLRDALELLRGLCPDVIVETVEGSSVDQLGWLRARRIDVGVLAGGYEGSDLRRLTLWKERVLAALPQDHRLASMDTLRWQDLRQERWLVRSFESGAAVYNYLIGKIAADGYSPNATMHLTSRENVLGMVGAGFGITIVPESLSRLSYPGVIFRAIADDDANLPMSAAWLATNDNPALRRFLNLLRRIRTEHR